MRVSRQLLGLVAALAILAGACALNTSSEPTRGAGVGDLIGREATAPARTSTAATATTIITTTPAPPTMLAPLAPPPTTAAVDPNETLVATVKPEISVLDTFERPDGEPVAFEYPLTNPTYFDNDLVLMVTDEGNDDRWLKVQIPVRPNGTEVWIRSADVTLSTHRFRAEVDLTERSVTVWNGNVVVAESGAVVGKDHSPTPIGSFYVNELITKWEGSAYGPYILGLSGFSEALDTFNGGVPVIAIHGTNRPELIGGAYSNGCIRIPNEVVSVLAEVVPMGTPVDIVA